MANHRLSSVDFINRAKSKFGDRFSYLKTRYAVRRQEVIITCKKHGDFSILPMVFLSSLSGCPKCRSTVMNDKFILKARKQHGHRYDYAKVDYQGFNVPVEIQCPVHGSFHQTPETHLRAKIGCQQCNLDDNRMNRDEFIKRSCEQHGTRYDYAGVDYICGDTKVSITCAKHGMFLQKPRIHTAGSGCPECFREAKRSTIDEFIRNAKAVHGDVYNYDHVDYCNSKVKVKIECPVHGFFWMIPNSHISSKGGCPKCKESKGESRIRVFLEKHKIDYLKEYKIDPFKYRYDYYLPDFNLLIEYHGIQHYQSVPRFGGDAALAKTQEHDRKKRVIAKEQNFILIEMGYWLATHDGIETALGVIINNVAELLEKEKPLAME